MTVVIVVTLTLTPVALVEFARKKQQTNKYALSSYALNCAALKKSCFRCVFSGSEVTPIRAQPPSPTNPVVMCPYLSTSDMGTAGVRMHQGNSSFEPFALMEAVRQRIISRPWPETAQDFVPPEYWHWIWKQINTPLLRCHPDRHVPLLVHFWRREI